MRSDLVALARSGVDRDGAARADPALLGRLAGDARTRYVVVDCGRVAVVAGGSALDLLTTGRLDVLVPDAARREPAGSAAPPVLAYLGRDAEAAYVVCLVPGGEADEPDVAGVRRVDSSSAGLTWAGLREVIHRLGDRDAGLAVTAVALGAWHDRHPRCPRCGERTVVAQAGWARRCIADGSEHYPRTDPAVIVAVTDEEDRLLLAHARGWPARRFSLVAGFVEPGESLESAARREVSEECGLEVGGLAYVASQPWPYPASLMVGFRATSCGGRVQVDDEEVTEARFVGRRELADQVAERSLLLPSRSSIARAMIEEWFGGRLPGE